MRSTKRDSRQSGKSTNRGGVRVDHHKTGFGAGGAHEFAQDFVAVEWLAAQFWEISENQREEEVRHFQCSLPGTLERVS